MIDCNHGLLPIASDCLIYEEGQRPSSEDVCQRLANLKKTSEYEESVKQAERDADTVQQLRHEIQTKEEQLQMKVKTIQKLSEQLEEQEQITAEVEKTNQSLQRQVEQMQQQLNQRAHQQQVRTS